MSYFIKNYFKALFISSIFNNFVLKTKSTLFVESKNFIVNLVLITYIPIIFLASMTFLILSLDRYFKGLNYITFVAFFVLFISTTVFLLFKTKSYLRHKLVLINKVKEIDDPIKIITNHWINELASEQKLMIRNKELK